MSEKTEAMEKVVKDLVEDSGDDEDYSMFICGIVGEARAALAMSDDKCQESDAKDKLIAALEAEVEKEQGLNTALEAEVRSEREDWERAHERAEGLEDDVRGLSIDLKTSRDAHERSKALLWEKIRERNEKLGEERASAQRSPIHSATSALNSCPLVVEKK